jgi:hypothetical protein
MPRTKGTSRRTQAKSQRYDPSLPPIERFDLLDLQDKLICWNYYQFDATVGEEGWNPARVGSVYHLRASNYINSRYTESQFRHKARSMVKLAEEFAKLNQAPPRPQVPQQIETATQKAPSIPNLSPPTMQSPQTPGKKISIPAEVNIDEQGLSVPTSFGTYKEFNYTSRKTTTKILIRQLCHSALEVSDCQYEWITPRKLQIRMAWPEWFRCAEQMAAFTQDEEGKIVFPPEHPVTMDTSERNEARVEEDGNVWDVGYHNFDQDMKMEDLFIELLDVPIQSKKKTVTVLQVLCQ